MAGTSYHRGVTGAPIIDDCLSYLDCRTYATYEGGDHTIFLGQVAAALVAGNAVVDLILGKPFDLEELRRTMAQLLPSDAP